jgi:Kelch motif
VVVVGGILIVVIALAVAGSWQWKEVLAKGAEIPTPRQGCEAALVHDYRMYLFGGMDGDTHSYSSDLFVLDLSKFPACLCVARRVPVQWLSLTFVVYF